MNRLQFYIDGVQSKSKPVNFEDLEVSINWKEDRGLQVEFDKLIWRGEDAEKIIAFRSDSLGSFVSRPLQINVVDPDGSLNLPPLLIDLRKDLRIISCNEVEHAVSFVGLKDWFKGEAGVIQFARLEEEGKFSPSDFKQVPYNINYIPDALQVVFLSFSIYNVSVQVAQFIKDTGETAAESAVPTTTAVAILKIVIKLAYAASIAIALKNLIKQLGEQLYSRTRYHTGIKYRSLFEKGCAELGLTFESTIFDDPTWAEAVLLPSKTERGKFNSGIKNGGSPRRNDTGLYFFGDFVETMKRKFNADYVISNGVFRFERWDYWQASSTFVIPENFNDQSRRLNVKGDNADDFRGGYFITFALDQKDQNTLDNYDRTAYDIITKPATNPYGVQYLNVAGSEVVDLPIALGTRKDTLSLFENILFGLFSAVDSLTNTLTFGNGGTDFAQQILNRTGNLLLSDHFTDVPKCVIMSGDILSPNQRDKVNAVLLYDDFHFINSFVVTNGKHNQWETFSMPLKICRSTVSELLINNFAKTPAGDPAEITNLIWTMEEDSGSIEYRVNTLYTTNLEQTFLTGDNTDLADNNDI